MSAERYSRGVLAVKPMRHHVLVELVNEWGTRARAEAGEEHEPLPPLIAFMAQADLPEPARTAVGVDDMREVADLLHPVFAAADMSAQTRLATDLLLLAGARPALQADECRVEAAWLVPDAGKALLAAAALALWQLLQEHPSALGTCAADRCVDVYVDASPAAHRRFCSVTCQGRTRVAAYRRRQRASRAGASP